MEAEYTVTVEAPTQGHADEVMVARLGCDEDYGFDYQVTYKPAVAPTPRFMVWADEMTAQDPATNIGRFLWWIENDDLAGLNPEACAELKRIHGLLESLEADHLDVNDDATDTDGTLK